MDKIEEMENVMKDYVKLSKEIDSTVLEKKKVEMSKAKEEERYDEAKKEFGEHTVNEYESEVLKEYEKNVKSYQENVNKLDED